MTAPTHWDRYWQSNRMASCMDGAGASNYDHRVAHGWRSFFEGLAPRSRVLDLCTGNGAVALIAAQVSVAQGKSLSVTGIDFAAIDPKKFVPGLGDATSGVEFVGNVNCETLAYPDASFDAVVSQYGIEYSDLRRSIPQAVRVIIPGGKLRLFIHAREGTVVASTKRAISDADFLLDKVKLCDRATACFKAVHVLENGTGGDSSAADRAFESFHLALGRVGDRAGKHTDTAMLNNAGGVLRHAFANRTHFPLSTLLEKASELKVEIRAHRSRQREMVGAALTSRRMADLAATLADLGMSDIVFTEQRPAGEFIGYVIEARTSQH